MHLELDLPDEPVNKLTRAVRRELGSILDTIAATPDVRAVVLASGKPSNFIAGADIDEFMALRSEEEALALVKRGQELVNRVEDLGVPVVAAIHGGCLGGGLELALACTYRIATDHVATVLGLPEVQLGILPALGGCQRLPRQIGLRNALDMILSGRSVSARRARDLGVVDELADVDNLDQRALTVALRLAAGWRPRRPRGGLLGALVDRNPLGRFIVFARARNEIQKKTHGRYPAPFAALDAAEHGLKRGLTAGLEREAVHFSRLALGDVSRNLVRIFFATTALKKDPGVEGDAPPPRPIRRLGVVGAGFMGSAIAGAAVTQARVKVHIRDSSREQVEKGLGAVRSQLERERHRRGITEQQYAELVKLVTGEVGWSGFERSDLVVEAVSEDLRVKQEVFREVEAAVGADCVMASNTSTIPIARIAEAVEHPDRVVGMHFFSPVHKMPLLEVIVTDHTAPWVVVTAAAFGRDLGKTVIVVRDRPGFWVNRILAPYLNEAGRLLTEGATVEAIDAAMTGFGFPVGPITLQDEVGLDVAIKGSNVLAEAFGARMQPADGLSRMVREGRLGRKSGRGFYRYRDGRKLGVDPAVYATIGAARPRQPIENIEERLVFIMLNEAVRALDEGVVRSARDGDVGAVLGIGFPPFRGGPLRYLDEVGAARAVELLEGLKLRHGERFAPAALLTRMAERSLRFYE